MKSTLAVAALLGGSQAVSQKAVRDADIYGANGTGYSNNDAGYDSSRIGIDIKRAGSGSNCRPGDWTTVHWVGTLKDGRVITDSRAEPGGLPKTFALGAHEVFKCWDLALPKLQKGSFASLNCPSYYAYGNAFTWPPVGGEPIPLNSDVDFDIEVVDCNRTPTWTEYYQQPRTTTMQPNKCMWLHLEEADSTVNDMVLTEQEGKAIVHHKQRGDASQHWVWTNDGKLKNIGTGKFLVDDNGDAELGAAGQNWWFDQETHTIGKKIAAYNPERNDWVMHKYLSVPKEHLMPGSEVDVLMARAAQDTNLHWRIEYCDVHDRT
jgi:hypothetical protein